jgi:hypothetical protein
LCGSKRIEIAHESFRALIPYRKPKFNDNGKYKKIERGREWIVEVRVSRGSS